MKITYNLQVLPQRKNSRKDSEETTKLQDIYDMWRSEALICIVKTKKGAAKK